jgi:hypothetical protein
VVVAASVPLDVIERSPSLKPRDDRAQDRSR